MSENLEPHPDPAPVHGPVSLPASNRADQAVRWTREYFAAVVALGANPDGGPPFAVASDGVHVVIARGETGFADPTITIHQVRTDEPIDEDGCITLEWVPILAFFPPGISQRLETHRKRRLAFLAGALADALVTIAREEGTLKTSEPRISVVCQVGGGW